MVLQHNRQQNQLMQTAIGCRTRKLAMALAILYGLEAVLFSIAGPIHEKMSHGSPLWLTFELREATLLVDTLGAVLVVRGYWAAGVSALALVGTLMLVFEIHQGYPMLGLILGFWDVAAFMILSRLPDKPWAAASEVQEPPPASP